MTQSEAKPLKPAALHLGYLDGLRGVASLYVVVFHAGVGFTHEPRAHWAKRLYSCLIFGHDAVAVFIVLSGYCLMLPVARADGTLTRSFGNYLARRAWRIIPPYYGALFTALLLPAIFPFLRTATGTFWDGSFPSWEIGPIATHVLLIHNLFPAWAYRINGPLWSVATEWQIYFLFPLFLLPVWRRAGNAAAILLGFALGCAPLWLAPAVAVKWNPWYLGLFAMGMAAAAIGFSARAREKVLYDRAPWRLVAPVLFTICVAMVLSGNWFRCVPLSDALSGATTASTLIVLSRGRNKRGSRMLALRALESRPLLLLGRFSYSLYLTHQPILALCYFALKPFQLPPASHMLTMLGLGVPSALLFAYGFYRLIEAHFVGAPRLFATRAAVHPN